MIVHYIPVLGYADDSCRFELDRTVTCEGDSALPIELLYLLFLFGGVYFVWTTVSQWRDERAERKRRKREGGSTGDGSK